MPTVHNECRHQTDCAANVAALIAVMCRRRRFKPAQPPLSATAIAVNCKLNTTLLPYRPRLSALTEKKTTAVAVFTERVSEKGDKIGRVRPIPLFLNRMTSDVDVLHVYGQ